MNNIFIQGEFQDAIKNVPNESVHLVLGDLQNPHSMTWMWSEVERVLKPGAVVILFGAQWNSHILAQSREHWLHSKYYLLRPTGVTEALLFCSREPEFSNTGLTDKGIYPILMSNTPYRGCDEIVQGVTDSAFDMTTIPMQDLAKIIKTFVPKNSVTLDLNAVSENMMVAAYTANVETHVSLNNNVVKLANLMNNNHFNDTKGKNHVKTYLY